MSDLVKNLGQSDFDDIINNSDRPILVDFWAEWCGPCRALTPILEEIAEQVGDSAIIAKVNVDENPNLAQKFNVRGIPTIIFFKNGEAKQTLVGVQPKEELIKALNELK